MVVQLVLFGAVIVKLYFSGHNYKYAAEQILLSLFPGERPEYPQSKPEGDRMEFLLSETGGRVIVSCVLVKGGVRFRGSVWVDKVRMENELLRDRYCQQLIKKAGYRAAIASGVKPPPWGALTGVRPGKLMRRFLEASSPAVALRQFMREYDVSERSARMCLKTAEATLAADASLKERDICLYVGIPFCPTRCSYCSFVSQSVEKSMAMIPEYLRCLHEEIRAAARVVNELKLRPAALYIGGGTPTTLSAAQLDELCAVLAESFDLSALREYTVEAGRPDTISEEKLNVLKRRGADRISVNPQTMSDSVLKLIGRKHRSADILSAIETVRRVGGFAVNMDIIAGLPSDSPEGFRKTVDSIVALSPENITVHTLSLKKGSGITLNGSPLPPADEVAEMLEYAGETLAQEGYTPYYLYRQKYMSGGFENAGYARKGHVNLYNICIMEELRSIIAMGGGGSTKLIRNDGGRCERLMAPKYPTEYIRQIESICSAKRKIADFYLDIAGTERPTI